MKSPSSVTQAVAGAAVLLAVSFAVGALIVLFAWNLTGLHDAFSASTLNFWQAGGLAVLVGGAGRFARGGK